jgi:hypothetical protein
MNTKKILALLAKRNLPKLYQSALYTGDIAFKTNRLVVRTIDIDQNAKKGRMLALRLLKQIDAWIKGLETLRDAAQEISDEADSARPTGLPLTEDA